MSIKKNFLILVWFLLQVNSVSAVTCRDVRSIMHTFFQVHYKEKVFNSKISKRSIDNFIKQLDPFKTMFLEKEVNDFINKGHLELERSLPKAKCDFIGSIYGLYLSRFEVLSEETKKLLKGEFDFTKDEYLSIDRKKLLYPKNMQEVKDRWRKKLKYQYMLLQEELKNKTKVKEKLKKNLELEVKRNMEDSKEGTVYANFLYAFARALGPHTQYMSIDDLNSFRIGTSLKLEGIGALLRGEDGNTKIQELIKGGAAEKSGLINVGDQIIAVSQDGKKFVNIINMDLSKVVNLIRGKKGSKVYLRIIRQEAKRQVELEVSLIRQVIQLKDRVAKSYSYSTKLKDKSTYKLGVIHLPSFYLDFEARRLHKENFRSSFRDLKKELEKLKTEKVDGVILDIRSNGGGSLDEAVDISGLFIGKNPVVQIKSIGNRLDVKAYKNELLYAGPLVVLMNRQSASGSEIMAAALRDTDRALLVGDTTFGKGTVQHLMDLRPPKLGAIKATVSMFYRINGRSTQLEGVDAQIAFPSFADLYQIGEKHYEYPIDPDSIKAAKYKNFKMVSPYLAELAATSVKRTKEDKDFDKIKKSRQEFIKNKSDRFKISLKKEIKKSEPKLSKANNKNDKKSLKPIDRSRDEKKAKAVKKKKTVLNLSNKQEKDTFKNRPNPEDDAFLKESLNIMIDYIRLTKKDKISSEIVKFK